MECNAEAEVRTQVLDGPDEDSHSPHTQVAAECRWVTDQGCDVPDPDHYYEYVMTMNDDALISDFSRDQVSYEENIRDCWTEVFRLLGASSRAAASATGRHLGKIPHRVDAVLDRSRPVGD